MNTHGSLALFSFLAGLGACRAQPSEPAPPPARLELVIAPPGARGARAAGTDAAPPPPSELAVPDQEPSEPDDETDGGSDGDAATAAPEADGGVTL